MFKRTVWLASVFSLLTATSAAAQPFWEKKPYGQWSMSECKKLLEDSPWSKQFVISQVQEDRFGQPTLGEARQTEQRITYIAQFRSTLPVRQAVVRMAQIQNKYDAMTPEQKKAWDDSAEAFLAAKFLDHIVVHVEYSSNVQFYEMDLARFWNSFPRGTIPQNVYLTTSSGTRVEAIGWKVEPGGSRAFEFFFPRTINGEPIVKSIDKALRLEFPNPAVRELQDTRAFFEFKLEKMRYKGEVSY